MSKRARTILIVCVIAVVAVAAGVLAAGLYGYWKGQADYDAIAETAFGDSLD